MGIRCKILFIVGYDLIDEVVSFTILKGDNYLI